MASNDNTEKKDSDLVVQTNKFVNAIHSLTLSELRILELVIVEARENNIVLTPTAPLSIDVNRYAERFNMTWEGAYQAMYGACETFKTKSWLIPIEGRKAPLSSQYLQDFIPIFEEGRFEITLTRMLIAEIAYLDGKTTPYTRYYLKHSSKLTSSYAIRLFQLLSSWRNTLADTKKFTPDYQMDDLRGKFGIAEHEYKQTSDFKKRVLDIAVKQINNNTDLTIDYVDLKRGKTITGFKFSIRVKKTLEHEGKIFEKVERVYISSDKQLKHIANVLSEDQSLTGDWKVRTYTEAQEIIEKDLKNNRNLNKYISFLKKHDFASVIKIEEIEVTPTVNTPAEA